MNTMYLIRHLTQVFTVLGIAGAYIWQGITLVGILLIFQLFIFRLESVEMCLIGSLTEILLLTVRRKPH